VKAIGGQEERRQESPPSAEPAPGQVVDQQNGAGPHESVHEAIAEVVLAEEENADLQHVDRQRGVLKGIEWEVEVGEVDGVDDPDVSGLVVVVRKTVDSYDAKRQGHEEDDGEWCPASTLPVLSRGYPIVHIVQDTRRLRKKARRQPRRRQNVQAAFWFHVRVWVSC
jgi:hypothetical protein